MHSQQMAVDLVSHNNTEPYIQIYTHNQIGIQNYIKEN